MYLLTIISLFTSIYWQQSSVIFMTFTKLKGTYDASKEASSQ